MKGKPSLIDKWLRPPKVVILHDLSLARYQERMRIVAAIRKRAYELGKNGTRLTEMADEIEDWTLD